MSLATILVATAAMAVNFGWQKGDDGYDYLVQLEPETLRLLQDGIEVPIDSHVPKEVQPIRRVRIVVGRAELPRDPVTGDEPRTDATEERSANFRPGETAPPPSSRYLAPPAATTPQLTLDTIVQPLRDADNLLERGFEAGVDGLENTGQAIRGAVGNLGHGVQEGLQRTKETLVGQSPSRGYLADPPPVAGSSGTATAPGIGAAPSWWSENGAATGGADAPLAGLPPPPMASGDPAASSAVNTNPAGVTNNGGPAFPANRDGLAGDNRGGAGPIARTDSSSRMVPVDPLGSPKAEADSSTFEPWPVSASIPMPELSAPSNSWPKSSSPAEPSNSASLAKSDPTTKGNPPESPPDESSNTPGTTDARFAGPGWTLLALFALFGSIGCNFFLGVSYLDIRNKYRAALRRTSRSFGRPAASA